MLVLTIASKIAREAGIWVSALKLQQSLGATLDYFKFSSCAVVSPPDPAMFGEKLTFYQILISSPLRICIPTLVLKGKFHGNR